MAPAGSAGGGRHAAARAGRRSKRATLAAGMQALPPRGSAARQCAAAGRFQGPMGPPPPCGANSPGRPRWRGAFGMRASASGHGGMTKAPMRSARHRRSPAGRRHRPLQRVSPRRHAVKKGKTDPPAAVARRAERSRQERSARSPTTPRRRRSSRRRRRPSVIQNLARPKRSLMPDTAGWSSVDGAQGEAPEAWDEFVKAMREYAAGTPPRW